jgi:hypothetical protein
VISHGTGKTRSERQAPKPDIKTSDECPFLMFQFADLAWSLRFITFSTNFTLA